MEKQNLTKSDAPLVISSRKKWLWLGIIVALINPIFAGLILGAVYLSEPKLRGAGKIVAGVAILWGAVLFYWLREHFVVAPVGF